MPAPRTPRYKFATTPAQVASPKSKGFRTFRVGASFQRYSGLRPFAVVDRTGKCIARCASRHDAEDVLLANPNRVLSVLTALDHSE